MPAPHPVLDNIRIVDGSNNAITCRIPRDLWDRVAKARPKDGRGQPVGSKTGAVVDRLERSLAAEPAPSATEPAAAAENGAQPATRKRGRRS